MAQKKTQYQRDLEKKYRKLAKRADQRLVRLEGLRHYKEYESVDKYAYAMAMRDIRSYSGEGAKRFNTKTPQKEVSPGKFETDYTALEHKITDIEKFLNSRTSTKSDIDKFYKEKAKQSNKDFGVNWTWQQWQNYWDSYGGKSEGNVHYRVGITVLDLDKKTGVLSLDDESRKQILRESNLDKIEQFEADRMAKQGITFDMLKRR